MYYANYKCYGISKVWQELKHGRVAAGCDQVAHIMRRAGFRSALRRKLVRTTYTEVGDRRSPGLAWRN